MVPLRGGETTGKQVQEDSVVFTSVKQSSFVGSGEAQHRKEISQEFEGQTENLAVEERENLNSALRNINLGVPVVAQWLTNLTRNHEVSGSVPALAQWVEDLALP